MKLVLNSITYHDCPVHLRERVAFTPEQQRSILRRMHTADAISEAVLLDTCNRVEFYVYARKAFDVKAFLTNLVTQFHPDAADVWREHSRQSEAMDVVRHLFEVAAGLDSQMIGENQILSQAKAAYTLSLECRMSKFLFHRLFHNAFRVGKAVRSETDINCGAVSLSLAAVELAKTKIHLPDASAMLIGAGENAELAAKYLLKAGLKNLIIANRSTENARAMKARLKTAQIIPLEDIPASLPDVDLIISSTAADEPVVTYESVKDILVDRKKILLIIDIAVPRDVDPDIARLECVSLYNIDDLDEQISRNRRKRSREIPKAQAIVADFTDKFAKWYDSLNLVPVITRLTESGLNLARTEAKRYARDFGPENSDKLRLFAESLVRKMLHGPINFLKNGGDADPSTEQLHAADLINKMFLSETDGD
jgi:glutamyl-tRNA reductase